MTMHTKEVRLIIGSGIVGILASLLVGIGEFTMQYSPLGGYEQSGYHYFADISMTRLRFGHFLGVLAAPFYLGGYLHVYLMLKQSHRLISAWIFGLGAYAFIIGDVWLGGRVNLALVVQATQEATVSHAGRQTLDVLLAGISGFNEPLIQIVRVIMLIITVLLSMAVLSGRSPYPRWFIAFTPFVQLIAILLLYFLWRPLGGYLLPPAMNVAHLMFFGGSTWIAWKTSKHPENFNRTSLGK